jgi:hypothetical protein
VIIQYLTDSRLLASITWIALPCRRVRTLCDRAAPKASALGIRQLEPQDQALEARHLVEIVGNLSLQQLLIEKMSQFVADRLGRENGFLPSG